MVKSSQNVETCWIFIDSGLESEHWELEKISGNVPRMTKIDVALTNSLYKFYQSDKMLLLRIYGPDCDSFIDRSFGQSHWFFAWILGLILRMSQRLCLVLNWKHGSIHCLYLLKGSRSKWTESSVTVWGNYCDILIKVWQPRARYRLSLDPSIEETKKLCCSLRRNAKEERILFHYNGHGVPKPTIGGEIWVFNKNYTQVSRVILMLVYSCFYIWYLGLARVSLHLCLWL